MGRYGGWGAADAVFAPGASGNDLRDRERLRAVLTRLGGSEEAGERLFRSAGLTVLNAHYTDPMLVAAIYRALATLGLVQGTVVDPGAGSGQFAAGTPDGIRITGIELDPATALIAQLLHPHAEILAGSVSDPRFTRIRDQSAAPVRVPRDTADGFAGNVPFSDVKWPDEVLNPGTRFSLHDHAIRWGVTRVAPGGLCAFITSRYTADTVNPRFRRTLAGELDLIGMVRLPSTAHKRMAGTAVVTDIIIGRRIADGERPLTSPETWEQSRPLAIGGSSQTARVNTYFHDNPRHILGTFQAGGMYRAGDFTVAPSGDLEQQLGAALGEIAGSALAAGQRHEPRPAARPVIEILSRRPDGTITAKPDGTFTQVVHGQDVPLVISSDREADQTRKLVALAEARSTLIKAEASCPEDTDEIDAMRSQMGELYDAYTAAYGPIGRFTTRTVTYHIKTLEGILDRLDFSRKDVPDPEVKLLEAYLGRDALTRILRSAADPEQVRHGTRKDKHGETVTVATQLVETARVRAALTAALAQIPQGADAEAITATFSERISRIETGEQRTRLMPAAFRSDPRRPAVEALETFDPVTQTATKKAVFSRRTAVPHRMELGADTPQEALDLVLIHRRRADLGEIARLLGTDEADARAQLGTLVFDDPATGNLVAAGEYLSGNVREKLAAAREAAAGDPDRYTANVGSLEAVQPPALAAEDIQARLGSAWLSREIVQEGLRCVLEDPRLTVIHPGGSEWKVESRTARNSRAQDTYGTSDWNALDLAGALLTNASITVRRTTIDPVTGAEKSYRDDAATLFAFRKAQRLDADFVSWLWSDPQRADECVRLYNSAYNNQVKRVWDASPFYIPGLAPGIRLHPFQNAMVRRLHTESGLAAWVVGAGKTELGIVAAMEGARLGRHELTAIVTPASLVNQWRDRIYRTYPEARVLVADDDLRGRKDSRAVFTERAASGDYQLAITPYEFFGSLALSADAARASVDEEIGKLTRYAEEAAAQGDRYTAKDLQAKIARLEAKYSAAVKASGGAAGFTDAGIDSVVVDEWHNFRRIRRDSNNRLLAMAGSGRANHMLAVFDYLRKHHPEGLRLGLSGTPLEQSIADAWAAMRFFTPERLKELGLEEFDAFLTTFGRTEPRREPTPTGSGLHVRERQADWFNLPDMRRTLWDPFADVVRRADLGLNLPRLAGGRPQTHVLPQTPGQAHMQADIDHRYELFKAGDRDGDNHILKLMDQAGKNALHPRMLGMDTDGKIKLEVWADHAAAWYHATKDTGFLDRDGNPHPVPGALRMVACELGVPDAARPNAWSVYSEMRSLLAARGVPAGAIRFAQDADNDRKKAALWEDARTGRCNFVIGSAQTAGTGVDVPDRLQVLDYMTLSWNPTQFEQWLGRIVRQGNQNPEVAAHVWATEGTIEVLRADKISMKSAPFEALLDGTSETRRLTEEDDNPISAWAAEMTARMSGNPLLTSQREAQLEVDVAQGMQNEWQRENGVKARRLAVMDQEIQELEAENAAIDDALSRAVDTRGVKFAARVGTGQYTVRAEAGAALIAALTATAVGDVSTLTGGNPQHLAELAGFPVTARYNRVMLITPAQAEDGQETGQDAEPADRTLITLGLEGVPQGQVGVIDAGDLPGRDPAALITSLEDRIRRLPGHRAKNTVAIAGNRDQTIKTRAELAQPSPYLQQLADARDALDRIEAQINEQVKDDTPAPDAAVPGAGTPAGATPAGPGASPATRTAAHADELSRAGAQSGRLAGELSGEPSAAAPASAAGEKPDIAQTAPDEAEAKPAAAGSEHEQRMSATSPSAAAPAAISHPDVAAEPDAEPATAADRPAATSEQPAPSHPALGLVIEHHQQGTLVHGTQKSDRQLHRILHNNGFRWSNRLDAWYLPRNWTYSTRNRRVGSLSVDLRQAQRSFTLSTQPPAPANADDAPPEPLPAADPYTDLRQARNDHSRAVSDYWALTRTPAGNNVMAAYPESGARPDALALNAAYKAVHVSWDEAFAGDPYEVAGQFTAWVQAAAALSRNLAAERHRAPVFRQTLDTFIGSATRLASRTQATVQDPAAWARVFAGVPGSAPASPYPGEAAPPEPGAPSAGNGHAGQDGDREDQAADPATVPAPSADAENGLPVACRNPADLRQLAGAHLLSTSTEPGAARGSQLTVVHDHGRTVLLHDDISGTSAGGYRLDPGEVPAYLATYLRHPQLPPRCLADLARDDPAAPGILTLTDARETAARHDLEVRVRRAAGRQYLTFCEPGVTGLPVLSYLAGTGSALHGPSTVPVAAINSYLLIYRHSIPAAIFTAPAAAPPDWARRVTQLTPHLIDEGGYFIRAAHDHLMAAFAAARDGNTEEAARLLGQAESATPPLTPSPEREAELVAVIGQHTARYGYTDDPAGYMARAVPPLLDASDREWDWVRSYISAHPEVREHRAQDELGARAAQPDDGRQQAAGKSRQAKAALESGDFEQALALLDEAELLYPDHGISFSAARDQVRSAMDQAGPGHHRDQDSPGGAGQRPDAEGAPGEPDAGQQQRGAGTGRPVRQTVSPAPGQHAPDDTEAASATPGDHYEIRIAGHSRGHQLWPATADGKTSAEQRARSLSARSDRVWEVRHLTADPAAEPVVVCRYRHGLLQLDDAGGPAVTAGEAAVVVRHTAGPPGGTQPLAAHAGWAGSLRPERLLYADGTPLTIRGQGGDNDQVLPATAAGAVPAPADSEYGSGRLQVVRWDDGQHAVIHPALASPAGIDAYAGLSDRDRARWEAFDLAEAWPATTAGLPPHLVDVGDVLQVERGPRSRTMDLREVQSARPGTGALAGGLEFKVTGISSRLFYPPDRRVPVCIPDEHPSLSAAIQAALAAAPDPAETTDPAPDLSPGARDADSDTAARGTAQATPQPAPAASAPPDSSQPGTTPQATATLEAGIRPAPGMPVGSGKPEPQASPLTNSDLAAGLRRLPGFARWLSQAGTPPAGGDVDSQRPGAGPAATCDARGIEITASGPGFARHGLVTWPQAASWIDAGVTPARLGIVIIADRLSTFCRTHRGRLIAAGTCDPDAISAELGQIRDNAIAMIVDAALRSRGTAAPVPPARPGDPAWYTAVMISRPDRAAGKAENAALERLTRLRTMIREPQPATAAEIRATIRQSVGYGLPDLVRALGDPAAMRTWISDQASRPVPGSYGSSGDRWYGASPEGLITDRSGDDRAATLIRWEEIPAWIRPGITSSLRDRLLAAADASSAVFRRMLTTAVHPDAGLTAPSEEEDKQAAQQRREAVDAVWAAIEAAPAPSPVELDHARHVYRDTSPVQQALFDDPPQDSMQAPDATRAAASRQLRPAPDPGTAAGPGPASPAHDDDPEPPQIPATNSDLAIALHHMSGQDFTSFLTMGKTPHHGSRGWRRDGLPDAGASEDLDFEPSGVRITVRSRGFSRHGQISWRQVASWIDTGLTPARLGIIIAASRLHLYTYARHDELIAAGKDNIDAAISELSQISIDAIDAALGAALSTRDADAPVPPARPGKPAYRTTAMLTRPDPAASAQENTALTRIAELEAAIRGAQTCTPAGIRSAIRWWIGDGLPEYARALASPEAMRAWIRRQAAGPASRTGKGSYDDSTGRYYSAYPEGLRTSEGSDTRTPPLILWEEIPAWIQPGLSASLRDRLAAAWPRPAPGVSNRTAAARPPAGTADPGGQADDPPPRPLREAIDAAWAAIEAAPPPSPAELDHARTVYQGTGTAQEPGSPAKTGRTVTPAPTPRAGPRPAPPPRRTGPAAHRQDELPGATAASTPAGPPPRHHASARAAASAGTWPARALEPAAWPPPASTSVPLTDDDIFLGISRLPAAVIGDLFSAIDTGQPLEPVGRQLAPYSGERAAGEPDPGTRETVTAGPVGLRIQVAPADSRRTGLITWPQIDDLLRPGLTPARRQIVVQATQVRVRFAAANASFRGVGEGRLAAAAEDELRAHAGAAVTAILTAARPAGGGQPPQPTDEAATIERIAELAAALPSQPPHPRTPAGQVTTGDIIGHPGYKLQPFCVSAPPRHADGAIEITGSLTGPSDGEPAGQITLTLTGHPDPFVCLIPPPARSLRSLPGGTTAKQGHTDRDHTRAEDGSPGDIAQPAARHGQLPATAGHPHGNPAGTTGTGSTATPDMAQDTATPAPSRVNGTGQPPGTAPLKQEDTMPAAPSATSRPPEGPAPADGPAPAVGPVPAAWMLVARPGPASQARPGRQPADDTLLLHELDHVLAAITERRRAAAPPGTDGTSFADIRAAFTVLRHALDLPGPASNGDGARPAAAVPGAAQPASPPPPAAQDGTAAHGEFSDIRAAFAGLRDVLGLPAPGSQDRPATPGPDRPAGPDPSRLLDQAAAEAHACARWYRDTPEWQRMSRIGRAARELLTAIREAAGDYWAEIRLDVRVRGFARTMAARVSLAVSGTAHLLAGRLEHAGHRNTRPWRAAWRLHQVTATFASRVMNYTPPGSPTRMDDARRVIDDLGRGTRRPGRPEPSRAATPPARDTRTAGAVALGRECFPVLVSRAGVQPPAAPAARPSAPPRPHQAPAAARR